VLVMAYLLRQFNRQQKAFSDRMQNLRQTLAALNAQSQVQSRQLQINEEFEKTIKVRKPQLGEMIFKLHFDLFQKLSDHQLLR
jgi:oligoendopeptidase F